MTANSRLMGSAALLAASVVWALLAPGYWVFTASIGLILAISTVGLVAVVGWVQEISLAHAGLTGTAVYVCAYGLRDDGLALPFLLAAAVAVATVVLLSVVLSLATARLSGIYILVLTLALQVTIEKTVFTYGELTAGIKAERIPRPALFGVSLHGDRGYFLFTLVVLVVVLVLLVRLRQSRFGRGLLLVGTDRQVASAVGVSPWRAKVFAFGIAGLCAGLAGALTAPLYSTPPLYYNYTALNSLFYLAIPVLAGFRSLLVAAFVAIAFQLVPQALEQYRVSPLALGAVGLLAGTVVGPGGISGVVLDRVKEWRRVRAGLPTLVQAPPTPEELATPERRQCRREALAVLERYLPAPGRERDILVAEEVSLAFGGLQALDGVSLTVPSGQLVGLIGTNGAGKTTLFDIINGLRTPDSGRIVLDGADITTTRAWERATLGLSRTFQASRLNLDLTVRENLLSGAYPMIPGNLAESMLGTARVKEGTRRSEEVASAVAELLAVRHYWDEPVRVLSFGNRRRVEIGRSLMSGPRVLLLDEPSAGLDPAAARLLFSLVKELHRDLGLTVLLVEHYMRAVLEHCDRVYVLGQGRLVAAGTPEEIAHHPDVRSQYLGLDFDPAPHLAARGNR